MPNLGGDNGICFQQDFHGVYDISHANNSVSVSESLLEDSRYHTQFADSSGRFRAGRSQGG